MIKRYGYIVPLLIFVLVFSSCGKNLFKALTSQTIPSDPHIALDRAEYLYLSGDVETADNFYNQLIDKYDADTSNKEVYYESLRGHAKCVIEIGTTDSDKALEQFLDFAGSVDTEEFEADQAQIDSFKQIAETYEPKLNESFNTLIKIPHDARTEGDYANISIAGVFSVLFKAVDFFQIAAQSESTIMDQISELNEKQEEFNSKWAEYEDDPTNTQLQSDLKQLANEIDTIYNDIISSVDEIVAIMESLQEKIATVEAETAPAENSISTQLNQLFGSINTAISGALPAVKSIQEESGEFYDNLEDAKQF